MTNKGSVSQRLHEELTRIIAAKQTGDRLPSEPELARNLGVSRATLREAMRIFETHGLIHRRQGSGTYVTRPSQVIESGLEVLESIETMAKRIGMPVSLGELHIESGPTNQEEAAYFNISPGDPVTRVSRVMLAEGQPAAYLIDILLDGIINPEDLQHNFTGSVFDLLLARKEVPLSLSRCAISAVLAPSDIARLLTVQRGDVLLCFESDLYNGLGKVIDHSFSYFLPGYFRFHVVRRIL